MTHYEVYDKNTGEAVTRKSDGQPVRTTLDVKARIFIIAYNDETDVLHPSIVDRHTIPPGAVLGVRPARGES